MANRLLTVVIQKEDDWFVAKCLENSVASQGRSIDEANEQPSRNDRIVYGAGTTL